MEVEWHLRPVVCHSNSFFFIFKDISKEKVLDPNFYTLSGSSTVSGNNMITTNHHTANNSSVNCMGRQLSLPTEQSGSIGSNGVAVSGVQTGNGSAVPSSTTLPGFNGILSNNSINSVAATGVVTSSVTSIYDKTKDTTEATEAIAE